MARARIPDAELLDLPRVVGAHCRSGSVARDPQTTGPLTYVAPPLDYDLLYDDLLLWEGKIPWMYLDSKGLVTVGVGFFLKTVEAAKKLPFVNTQTAQAATAEEITTAYDTVAKMEKAHRASYYKLELGIELPDSEIKDLAIDKLRNTYVPAIRRFFSDFDSYPDEARRALLDLAYNGGASGTSKLSLASSVRARNWNDAADKVPIRGNPKRTTWRQDMFRQAGLHEPVVEAPR